MAPTTLYTVPAAPTTCRGCQQPLPPDAAPQRLYCDDCRQRRRAVTFLRSAHDVLVGVDDAAVRALDEITARLEPRR